MQGENKSKWHLLREHLQQVAQKTSCKASKFGSVNLGYLIGLLHDAGKYSHEFQKKLDGDTKRVDHSTAGAIIANENYGILGKIMAYVIAGHHSGIPDGISDGNDTSLTARLSRDLCDYGAFFEEIDLLPASELFFPDLTPVNGKGFSVHFLIRFLYSCLVDADFLDTEKAIDLNRANYRNDRYTLDELRSTLDWFIDCKSAKATSSFVNQKRAEILYNCRQKSSYPPGLFSLTVPTGGGKTLSSLSFALRHANHHGKDRVIYVIPFTSIIEQNAAEFKNAIGVENVLEHHSNFVYPEEEQIEAEGEHTVEAREKLKLATENWDMPVIVTTNVQLFESLFASRSSKCRKLHNVTNSVIVIDEAQMLPTGFLKPCLSALVELTQNYNSTVVFCTATQPSLHKLLPENINPTEIIEEPIKLYQDFKRVQVNYMGSVTDNQLAQELMKHEQVLCIVNSKKHARELFALAGEENCFHLSTRMCPVHRTEVLQEIKKRLQDGSACRIVSTQLIEAGVDVDFPVVYRSMAGIDSIAQSAGRCNREGLQQCGQVNVFWPEKHGMPRGWLSRTAELGSEILEQSSDPLAPREVHRYFSLLYEIEDEKLDKKGVIAEIKETEKTLDFPFRSLAEKFKLIEENTSTIIIPRDESCQKILAHVERSFTPGAYIRELQRYSVEIFEKEYKELYECGFLRVVADRYYVLKEDIYEKYYQQDIGLKPFTENMFLHDNLII